MVQLRLTECLFACFVGFSWNPLVLLFGFSWTWCLDARLLSASCDSQLVSCRYPRVSSMMLSFFVCRDISGETYLVRTPSLSPLNSVLLSLLPSARCGFDAAGLACSPPHALPPRLACCPLTPWIAFTARTALTHVRFHFCSQVADFSLKCLDSQWMSFLPIALFFVALCKPSSFPNFDA